MIREIGEYTINIIAGDTDASASRGWYEKFGLMDNEARATFISQFCHVTGDWMAVHVKSKRLRPGRNTQTDVSPNDATKIAFLMGYVRQEPVHIKNVGIFLYPPSVEGADFDCRMQLDGGWADDDDDSQGVMFMSEYGIRSMLEYQADWPEEVHSGGSVTLHVENGEPINWENYR